MSSKPDYDILVLHDILDFFGWHPAKYIFFFPFPLLEAAGDPLHFFLLWLFNFGTTTN